MSGSTAPGHLRGGCPELDFEFLPHKAVVAVPQRRHNHRLSRLLALEGPEEVHLAPDLAPVQARDDVTRLYAPERPHRSPEAGLVGWGAGGGVEDEDALRDAELPRLLCLQERDAENRPRHLAALDDLLHDLRDSVARDRKPDAGRRSAGREDGGVHPDESSAAVQERAAGVSGVDSGVGLDHVADRAAGRRRRLTSEPRDHPGGERVVQSEWVADGECNLTNLHVCRLSDCDGTQCVLGSFDLQHSNVFVRVDSR
mmetsp:Transcript_8928/g.17474  ORF Transcript_8928/g.17474 Transcript_8928/m.17474 type:complete len:256 (-) Transcript_8928:301-1068(-)